MGASLTCLEGISHWTLQDEVWSEGEPKLEDDPRYAGVCHGIHHLACATRAAASLGDPPQGDLAKPPRTEGAVASPASSYPGMR